MNLPRMILITCCTEPSGTWYQDLVGTTFTVTESYRDYYVVDEYEITTNRCIPLMIKKSDCAVVHW
jgi:hypothetical protein